ncbi:hypothetical protein PR003_g27672, partial [Phytophthora rubi]
MPHDDADAVQAPGAAPVPVPGQAADQVGDDAAGDQFDASTRESGRGASDSSGDRLDRLEGLIEGLVRDAARDRMEKAQLQHGVYVSNSSAAGSSAFSQFLAARRQRVRADSLSEVMGISPAMQQQQFAPAQPQPVPFQQHAPAPDPRLQQQQFEPPRGFGLKIPSLKDMKLPIERFSGKEMYEGLGAGFKDWGLRFLDEFIAAQVISGGDWPEDFKARALNRYLEGPARKYFDRMKTIWSAESPTLEHLMNRMLEVYEKEITVEQATRMMRARKRADRTWTEQYQYLLAIASAADCSDRFVLQYICECASPDVKRAMQTRIDRRRADHLRQAWELADFASTLEADMNGGGNAYGRNLRGSRSGGHGGNSGSGNLVANAVKDAGSESSERRCWRCGEPGHLKKDCTGKKKEGQAMFALAVGNSNSSSWVLDSGASRHLVQDASLLIDPVDCSETCKVADGQSMSVTKKGSIVFRAAVDGTEHDVVISNVYFGERLAQNLLSYCKLEEKGFALVYKGKRRYLARVADGARVFEVEKMNGVLVVNTVNAASAGNSVNVDPRDDKSSEVYAALEQAEKDSLQCAPVKCTLMELHERLGHLMFDTVERMADASGSGIELTDRARINCLTCAKGKQSKNAQSKQDSGKNAPIDRIGGVICSDLKGPMTPTDRNGNR